jgi:hypothetical protein
MTFSYGHSHLVPFETYKIDFLDGSKNLRTINLPTLNDVPAKVLIQLSGGIDSTYVLWKWLTENPEDYCLVHHINLIEIRDDKGNISENRYYEEKVAVDKILKWLDSKGLNNYFYVENTFDYGNFTSCLYDVELCGLLAGILLQSPRWQTIEHVFHPIYGWETEREDKKRNYMNMIAEREINSVYPLAGLSKSDVIRQIPKELLDLCWYCRNPQQQCIPCRECHTCKEVEKAYQEIRQDEYKDFLKGL